MAYATLAQLKEYLPDNPTVGAGTYDALLTTILDRATAAIDRITRRTFGKTAAGTAKLFDGSGTRALTIPQAFDLVSVDSNGLEVKLDGTSGSVWTVVPTADFFLEPAGRASDQPARWIELSDSPSGTVRAFTAGKRTVRITGVWGWNAVPKEIEEACLEIAVRVWRARGAGFGDAIGVADIDQIIVTKALPALSHNVLNRLTHRAVFA